MMKKYIRKGYYFILAILRIYTIIYNRILNYLVSPPLIHNTDETIQKLRETDCSISRYGDGEFLIMYGWGLPFQSYSLELCKRLREIVVSDNDKHLVCIPYCIKSTESFSDISVNFWKKHLDLHRGTLYKMLNMKKEYYDSQVTRLYIDHKDKSKAHNRFKRMKELWKDKQVIIVEGEKSRLGLGNDLFDNVQSFNRIICPSRDAFERYNDILNEVKKHSSTNLFLLALGPTATVLAYDLSKIGFQAIDIGHIDIEYEWFLNKAIEKVPVKNKYVNEAVGGTNIEKIQNPEYRNSILAKII